MKHDRVPLSRSHSSKVLPRRAPTPAGTLDRIPIHVGAGVSTSRDNTSTFKSRCNTTYGGVWREVDKGEDGRARTPQQLERKGDLIRKAHARYSVQSRSTNEASVCRIKPPEMNAAPQTKRGRSTYMDQEEHLSQILSGPSSSTSRCREDGHVVQPRRSQRSPLT